VDRYDNVGLNSATDYITPNDMLAGRQQVIHAERDRKLDAARKLRQIGRQQAASDTGAGDHGSPCEPWRHGTEATFGHLERLW
jgi:hypothetical protein